LLKVHKVKYFWYFKLKEIRKNLRRQLYKSRIFNDDPIIVRIDKKFGIEEQSGIEYYLETAASFIDLSSKELRFDLTYCNRIWPSGIVLLCSLKQWIELSSKHGHVPLISSSPSNNSKVNSYLGHCGFYDYVGRIKDTEQNYYSDKEIVKIRREKKRSYIEEEEKNIIELLRMHGGLNSEEIEWFDSVILTEVFNNVTEHGVGRYDQGWWLLAQCHKEHKVISLCIADNGIGIRNSLMTGPQREDIGKRIKNAPKNDGKFIKLALEENISGAFAASLKLDGIFRKRYKIGARRGNGLERIHSACKLLGIPFSILSHYGYIFFSANGNIDSYGAKANRVFAGTMYHFTIRTKCEGGMKI